MTQMLLPTPRHRRHRRERAAVSADGTASPPEGVNGLPTVLSLTISARLGYRVGYGWTASHRPAGKAFDHFRGVSVTNRAME
jgi:hypothetical protein